MESTSGTPLGTLRLGRQRPLVWCCYSGRIEHRDIIGLGKSSKFQWSWWGSQTENENTVLCIFFPLSVSFAAHEKQGKKAASILDISSHFCFSFPSCILYLPVFSPSCFLFIYIV